MNVWDEDAPRTMHRDDSHYHHSIIVKAIDELRVQVRRSDLSAEMLDHIEKHERIERELKERYRPSGHMTLLHDRRHSHP